MISLKTPKEVYLMRECGRRLAHIVFKLSEMVEPGLHTNQLNEEALRLVSAGGDSAAFLGYSPQGNQKAFPAALCVSVNEEVVHGIPNEPGRTLNSGDIVTLDMGLSHQGLITDMAVTLGVGEVSLEAQKLIACAQKTLQVAINQARAGNTTGDIGFSVKKEAKKCGFSVVHELGGHGVGYSVHEDPFIPNLGKPGTGAELKPGMVIAIEPIITEGSGEVVLDKADGYTYRTRDGKNSAQFEHTVHISKQGPEILTLQ